MSWIAFPWDKKEKRVSKTVVVLALMALSASWGEWYGPYQRIIDVSDYTTQRMSIDESDYHQTVFEPSPHDFVIHEVKKGENLTAISRLYNVSVNSIFDANKSVIQDKHHVREGIELIIPPRQS